MQAENISPFAFTEEVNQNSMCYLRFYMWTPFCIMELQDRTKKERSNPGLEVDLLTH